MLDLNSFAGYLKEFRILELENQVGKRRFDLDFLLQSYLYSDCLNVMWISLIMYHNYLTVKPSLKNKSFLLK